MQIKQFVADILKKLEPLIKKMPSQEETIKKQFGFLYDSAENRSRTAIELFELAELKTLLNFLHTHEDSELEVTQETLQPFSDFFSERWKRLKQNPTSAKLALQKAYIIATESLAAILNAPAAHEHQALLMPTTKLSNFRPS